MRKRGPAHRMFLGFSHGGVGIGLGAAGHRRLGLLASSWPCRRCAASASMIAMIAAQKMTISTLPVHLMKDASGLINLIRNVGGAIGLAAMLPPSFGHQTARHMTDLASAVSTASHPARRCWRGYSR